MDYKGRPSNYLFQLFLSLSGTPEENSSYFSNVQPFLQLHVHWMHLLNNRICRYTYITPTVHILHYCDQNRCVNDVVQLKVDYTVFSQVYF